MIMRCKQCPLEAKPDPRLQCVSLGLITLLVFATLTIVTVLAFNPIILFNIAQIKSGQRDFILKPKTEHFNTTRIAELTHLTPLPRLEADLVVGQGKRAVGWFMDFRLEKQHGLGNLGADLPKGHNFVFVHRSLGLAEGEEVRIQFEDNATWGLILQLANTTLQLEQEKNNAEQIQQRRLTEQTLEGTFIVKEVFDDSKGKMAQANGCIFLDINTAFHQIVQSSLQNSALKQFLTGPRFKLADIATEATINLPNRIAIYNNPNSQEVLRTIQLQGQQINEKVGFFAIGISMPILIELQTLQYFGMFIGVMLKAIIVSLFLLSVLMLDSTLQMGVDRQKADLAILKVVGASRTHVAAHILGGAVRQVFFANLIAYPLVYLTFNVIESTVIELIGHRVQMGFTIEACASGAIVGLLVPIIAAVSPIKNIIGNDLAESLGQSKPNYSQMKTQIYVQGQQFPWGKVTFGIVATAYGLAVYYLLPKAMININLGLMISLFFIFLEGLLIGLVILSYSFEFLLEGAMAKILLFWIPRTDFALTVKNLSCHRMQNRKTSLIYALAVSFVIMIAVGFELQIDATKDEYLKVMGGDIDIGGYYVNPAFINKILPKLPGIESLTFMTDDLFTFFRNQGSRERVMASDKAKLFFIDCPIVGIAGPFLPKDEENGRQVLYTDSHPPYNIYTYLDSEEGQDTCTLGEYAANKLGILNSKSRQFYINIYYKDRVRRVPMNYSSVISKRKGLFYYPFAFPESAIGVSFQTYKKLAGITNDEMPVFRAKLYVKDRSLLPQIADMIWQQVRNNTQFPQDVDFVWQRGVADESFGNMKRMLNAIMMTLLVLVLILCFFSLLTTTHANIRSQQKEIGVLMVLGYEKTRILRVYIYEAFVLVANSCCKGFVAGYIVATIMAWQRELFSSVTVTLDFKISYLAVIFAFAVVSSLLATYRALKDTLNKKISDLLSVYN